MRKYFKSLCSWVASCIGYGLSAGAGLTPRRETPLVLALNPLKEQHMSSTTSLAPSTVAINSIVSVFKNQIANLLNDEIIAVAPAVETFLTWVNANPQGAVNPVAVMPQLVLLQTAVIAAQANAQNGIISLLSGSLLGTIQTWAAAAKAAATPAVASTPAA